MKKLFTVCIALLAITATYAQQLKTIWRSQKSNDDKYALVSKIRNPSLKDHFAIAKISFDAGKNPFIEKTIWEYETLLLSQKDELEKEFPGICAWYESQAKVKGINLFAFSANPLPEWTISDLEQKNPLPETIIERAEHGTMLIHQTLLKSENLTIDALVKSLVQWHRSLNGSEQQVLDSLGYPKLWQEQRACYEHKQREKNCICGGKLATLAEFPTCGSKELKLLQPEKLAYDEPTNLLFVLNEGNMFVVKKAKEQKLNVWGAVKGDIIKQLAFLHLAALGEAAVPSEAHINLTNLWNTAERNQSNDYLKQLGFTLEKITQLQNYYSCILGAKEVANKKSLPAAFTEQSDQAYQPAQPLFQQPYTAENLSQAIDVKLHNDFSNRPELSETCLNITVLNDSTYEVMVGGNCGNDSVHIFPVGEYKVLSIANFFAFVGNTVVDQLNTIPDDLGVTYGIRVIGTADQIPYRKNGSNEKNEDLAQDRAHYIMSKLSKKATEHATSITSETITGLPVGERYAALRFILTANHQQP